MANPDLAIQAREYLLRHSGERRRGLDHRRRDVVARHAFRRDRTQVRRADQSLVRVLRPLNYSVGTPGKGASVVKARDGRSVLVVNVMCRLFMELLDDPFVALDTVLNQHPLGSNVDAALIDIHGEATSEKAALAHIADGRASVVVGTHTHIPTADAQVLPGGTAFQSDAGMCGDYDSVIGMKKEAAINKFTRKMPAARLEPAEKEGTACAVLLETDDRTGLAKNIEPVRVGGRLHETA